MSPFFPGAPDTSDWEPHFLMTLGPAIRPDHEVRTGSGIVRSARVCVDIDLLLTAKTISEAADQTRQRHAGLAEPDYRRRATADRAERQTRS